MGSNIAQKRAAKAQRRKAIVTGKRKAEITATGGSLVERVRRATEGRIFRSAVQESLGRLGFGMVILVRESAAGELAMGGFLLDAHEGVKDAVFRSLGAVELDRFYEMVAETGAFGPIEPADARKLLHEAVARAQALGIRPHRDFTTVEAIYGDVRIEDSMGIPAVAGWGPDRLGAHAGEVGAPPAETGEPQEVGNAQRPPTDREP
ncbi:MAG: hypothetical protein ACHQHK_02040 [Dongiales bacterium]